MVGFIKSIKHNNSLKKVINNIFLRIKIAKVNDFFYKVEMSKDKLKKEDVEKLKRKLLNDNITAIVISKQNEEIREYLYQDDRFKILDGKILMNHMIQEIVYYIYSYRQKGMYEDDLYVLLNNDNNIDSILEISEQFKTVNFVTQNIKKLKRLDKRLEKWGNIVYSISENYSKALRRAKIIINFDFDEEAINSFKTRKDSIIINCCNQKLRINKGFKGVIIENIEITFDNEELKNIYFDNLDNTVFYESSIYNLDHRNARKRIKDDKCEILGIIGKHGIISPNELKENIY